MNLESRIERAEDATGIGDGVAWLHLAELLADGTYKMHRLDGVEVIVTFDELRQIGTPATPIIILDR